MAKARRKVKDDPEIEEALAKIPEEQRRQHDGYCPTDRDQEIYRTWSRCNSIEKTVQELGVSRQYVWARLTLVRAWLQDKFIDDAASIRAQHISLLMNHYEELSQLWNVATRIDPACNRKSAPKKGTTNHGTIEKLDRPIQIIKEMRETLKTIAAYVGVLKPAADGGSDGGEGDERVAGIPRTTYIQNQIVNLKVQLQREQEMDAARAARNVITPSGG